MREITPKGCFKLTSDCFSRPLRKFAPLREVKRIATETPGSDVFVSIKNKNTTGLKRRQIDLDLLFIKIKIAEGSSHIIFGFAPRDLENFLPRIEQAIKQSVKNTISR